MEHLGSLNPFSRGDEEKDTGDSVALQDALAEYANIKPEVHKQIIADGVKLITIGTTTQNSLHFIFNDPVKGLFGCLKSHIEKKTMRNPKPIYKFKIDEVVGYWRLDPYGIYAFNRLQRVWWAKHVHPGIKTFEKLKLAHEQKQAKRKQSLGVKAIPKKFNKDIDSYFKVDNSSAFSMQQLLCREMQNEMYFTTLAYIPQMMDEDTKRVYQRYLDRWYNNNNCHGRQRVERDTRIPIYTVYSILHHICKPATVGEMYKDITLAERHRRHNCEQWWDDLERRRNNLNLYLSKEQERNLANEASTASGRNAVIFDRNLIPSISAAGLIQAETDRRVSAVAREVVVAFVNQLSSDERESFRTKTSEFIARGRVDSNQAVDYYPLNSGVMNMPRDAALNPFATCASQNAQDVRTNATLFDHIKDKSEEDRVKNNRLKLRLKVPNTLYRSNLFHYSWTYLGKLSREICLGRQASFVHNPRDTFKGSNRTYGPAAREKIDSLKAKIKALKLQVKELKKSVKTTDKQTQKLRKPIYNRKEHMAAKEAGDCGACLQHGLGIVKHPGACDPAHRKRNVEKRIAKGTLYKPYATNESGALYSQRNAEGVRKGKSKTPAKSERYRCKYCDKANQDTKHAERTTCLYQRLEQLGVNKREWPQYTTKFIKLRKKYAKQPGKALSELLMPLENDTPAKVLAIKRKHSTARVRGQPSKKPKINVSFRQLPQSEESGSDSESGEPDTQRRR